MGNSGVLIVPKNTFLDATGFVDFLYNARCTQIAYSMFTACPSTGSAMKRTAKNSVKSFIDEETKKSITCGVISLSIIIVNTKTTSRKTLD